MKFVIFSDRSKAVLQRFEGTGRHPNSKERQKLEMDLAELDAAAERIRVALKTEKPRRRRPK